MRDREQLFFVVKPLSKIPFRHYMCQMLSVSGTSPSKACWGVLVTESQVEFTAALDPKIIAPTDGAVVVRVPRRELSIADAYAFSPNRKERQLY